MAKNAPSPKEELYMEIKNILERSDQLFAEGRNADAVSWLTENLALAVQLGKWENELPMLNELMGYYRSISRLSDAWEYAGRAVKIVEEHRLRNTVDGMTTYLNVANVYRASGNLKEAMKLYKQVECVYHEQGMEHDYRLGGLYNNMSVISMDTGKREDAVIYGEKAVVILKEIPGAEDECATVYGNLAGVMLQGNVPDIERADEYADDALYLFEKSCADSPHYGGALAMKAYITYLKKDYSKSARLYEKAIGEVEKHYGKNAQYELLVKNYEKVKMI